jgi:AcrR family transcriptional regulator
MRVKGLDEDLIQQYIAEALLLLMKDRPFGKITIQAITDRAGVNRSSYYRHFDSKEDIIRYYLMGIMDEYQAAYQAQQTPTFRSYTRQIFTTFYAHREDLLRIHRDGLSYLLLDVLNTCFKFDKIQDRVASVRQFAVSYHIGGIYNNMRLWLDHGMAETPEQMAAIALSFRPEGSFTLLNVK